MKKRTLDLVGAETNIISVSVGKKYLYKIADNYTHGYNDIDEYYREIDNFIRAISDKTLLNNFVLPEPILNFIYSKNANVEIDKIDNYDDKFSYNYLLFHLRYVYGDFIIDRETGKVHLFLNFEAKEPEENNTLEDTATNYKSILCKFYLNKYRKYTKRRQDSPEGWTYQLSMLYLYIIGNLYQILRPLVTDIAEFVTNCLLILNPIITGFTATTTFNIAETKALSVLYELSQLTSSGKHLHIHTDKKNSSTEFVFSTLGGTFHDSMKETPLSNFKGDNAGKRLVKLLITGSGNTLFFRMGFVGLGVIEDVTKLAGDKEFYSLITDEVELEAITYKTLRYMLSHTQQHSEALKQAEEQAFFLYKQKDRVKLNRMKDKDFKTQAIRIIKDDILFSNAFTTFKPEQKLELAKNLIEKFKLQKSAIDYVIIAIELAQYNDKTISEKLYSIASKQQAQIRKMIKLVKEHHLYPQEHVLNNLYQEVSYRK